MKYYLKFGGLGLSAILTLALFARLFGIEAYGVFMALSALTLFEGGAIAWNHILGSARLMQRSIAWQCQWLCILLSIASSGAEIALSTTLWKPPFDIEFVTLCMIVLALAVNIVGVVAYEGADEDTLRRSRELQMRADNFKKSMVAQKRIIERAYNLMDDKVEEKAGEVAEKLATELRDDAIHEVLLSSPRGHNRQPVIDNAQSRIVSFQEVPKPKGANGKQPVYAQTPNE